MRLSDFDYTLPEELIATQLKEPRNESRLLVYKGGGISDDISKNVLSYIADKDLVIFNDTKVISAELEGVRVRGDAVAKVRINLSKKVGHYDWECFAKPLKKLEVGDKIIFSEEFTATVKVKSKDFATINFEGFNAGDEAKFFDALHEQGNMPLPPYITSKLEKRDKDYEQEKYQTVFAKNDGAVAAPTASLHFTKDMMDAIPNKEFVTLHVGAGTFLPVKTDDLSEHKMHSEWGEITEAVANRINQVKANGGRIFAIGTTALRILESAIDANGKVTTFCGETDIFITPPYDFKAVDVLMTNFHLPKSTLIMLVSAFVNGRDNAFEIYNHAIENNYRFYSFGDSSLLFNE